MSWDGGCDGRYLWYQNLILLSYTTCNRSPFSVGPSFWILLSYISVQQEEDDGQVVDGGHSLRLDDRKKTSSSMPLHRFIHHQEPITRKITIKRFLKEMKPITGMRMTGNVLCGVIILLELVSGTRNPSSSSSYRMTVTGTGSVIITNGNLSEDFLSPLTARPSSSSSPILCLAVICQD